MTNEQKELFKKQLESYKKELGIEKETTLEDTKKIVTETIKEKTSFLNSNPNKVDHTINKAANDAPKVNIENKIAEAKSEIVDFTKKITPVKIEQKATNIVEKTVVKEVNLDKNISSKPTTVEASTEKANASIENTISETKTDIVDLTKKTEAFNIGQNKSNTTEKDIIKVEKIIDSQKKESIPRETVSIDIKEEPVQPTTNIETPEPETKEKRSKLIFLIIPLLGVLGFFAYKYITSNQSTTAVHTEDINQSDEKNDISNNETEPVEDANTNTTTINIADTIYNLSTNNPTGYYAIIGAYGENKNAVKLQKRNKTSYECYILKENNYRVALKIDANEDEIFYRLNDIKTQYPQAWLLYNTEK